LHSKDYADSFERGQDRKRLERLIPHITINPGATVGDFGCGNSLLLECIEDQKQKVEKYYGVDFSKDLLAYAAKRSQILGFTQAQYYQGSIEDFCKEHQGELDLAIALDISEHVYDEEWLEILKAIHGALKPGGSLYIHTPNGDFLLEIMKRRNFILKQFPEHIAVRNDSENLMIIRHAGFTTVKIHYLSHYNRLLRYMKLFSRIPFIGKYFRARLFFVATK
jgi:2-polyprenyl-3-methyl-5-hydroxy-6-metoxy-1,4-benzoquinol methylase